MCDAMDAVVSHTTVKRGKTFAQITSTKARVIKRFSSFVSDALILEGDLNTDPVDPLQGFCALVVCATWSV